MMTKARTIDFTRDGKQAGTLDVPLGRGRKPIRVPVIVVRNGEGPGVLLTGGNHGDEYEGPVALMKLAARLEARDLLCGTVIVMPLLNPPAIAAATRTSPLDGQNLNRVFPGKADGSPSERLAHRVVSEVLPHVDTVYDLHAGGRTHMLIPSVMYHRLPDKALMARTVAAMKAFRAPAGILIKEFESEGMIDTTAERLGKVFGCCELGGAGMLTPETVAIAETGVQNLLIHTGLLKGRLRTPVWRGHRKTRYLEALSFDNYVHAPEAGIFEPFVDLGDAVQAGEPVGQIYDIERPWADPDVIPAPATGIVFARQVFGLLTKGRMLVLVAQEADEP